MNLLDKNKCVYSEKAPVDLGFACLLVVLNKNTMQYKLHGVSFCRLYVAYNSRKLIEK